MYEKLLCPHCHGALTRTGGALRCERGHSYDLAAEGYVNLAPGKSGAGDSREMCRARRDFLAAGFYRPFAEAVAGAVRTYAPAGDLCDAGCGEGYYLRVMAKTLPERRCYGFDLAKDSVRFAAKASRGEPHMTYAVAGIFDLPLPDASFAALTSVFAPVPDREAHRILAPSGILLVAHPGKDHLSGLKALLYDRPYDNEEKELSYEGFAPLTVIRCRYSVAVPRDMAENLLLMTPYYWRTSREDAAKLHSVPCFETVLDFLISVFRTV